MLYYSTLLDTQHIVFAYYTSFWNDRLYSRISYYQQSIIALVIIVQWLHTCNFPLMVIDRFHKASNIFCLLLHTTNSVRLISNVTQNSTWCLFLVTNQKLWSTPFFKGSSNTNHFTLLHRPLHLLFHSAAGQKSRSPQ